jgi:hypothetical protein
MAAIQMGMAIPWSIFTSNLDRLEHVWAINRQLKAVLDDFLEGIATAGFTMG